MNIAEFSIKKNVITWLFAGSILIGGLVSYGQLSRLEDPEFSIKTASVVTPYPGASPKEVEQEVTDRIEQAVQQMGQLEYLESRSTRGLSIVNVNIKDRYNKQTIPQVWDELRRKVSDVARELPPGAGPSFVNDDFGDVYGIFYAITGDNFSYAELEKIAEKIKQDLLRAKDVKKIVLYGVQPEVIYLEMDRAKMASLGVSQGEIYQALSSKNLVVDAGSFDLGKEVVALNPPVITNPKRILELF